MVETPRRKYNSKDVWDSLSKITTKLEDDDDKKRNKKYSQYCLSSLDIAVNGAIDGIFEANRNSSNNQLNVNANSNVIPNENENEIGDATDKDDEGIEVDPADMMNDETNLEIDDSEGNGDTQNTTNGVEVEVEIRNEKKMNVTKAPVNPLSLCDIRGAADVAVGKKNWGITRARKRQVEEIALEYRMHVYDTVLRKHNEAQVHTNDDEMDITAEGFARLNNEY